MGCRIHVGENAFTYCQSLTSVGSLSSVTSIGEFAFNNCRALTTVGTMSSLETLGARAFYNCYVLTTAVMPLVKTIGEQAFYSCRLLTTVEMQSATYVGSSAFNACSVLTTVKAYSLQTIASNAFYNCSNMTMFNSTKLNVCVLPQGLETIDSGAFYNCAFNEIHFPSTYKGMQLSSSSAIFSFSASTRGSTLHVYFNGSLTSMSAYPSTFSTTRDVVVYCMNNRYDNFNTMFAEVTGTITWNTLSTINVTFQTSGTGYQFPTTYSNLTAVQGGKIVLPSAGEYENGYFVTRVSNLDFGASAVTTEGSDDCTVLSMGSTWQSVAIYPTGSGTSTLYVVETSGSSISVANSITISLEVTDGSGISLPSVTSFANLGYGSYISISSPTVSTGVTVGDFKGTLTGATFDYGGSTTIIYIAFYEKSFLIEGAEGTYTIYWVYETRSGGSTTTTSSFMSGSDISNAAPTISASQIPNGYESTVTWTSVLGVLGSGSTMPRYNITYTAVYTPIVYELDIIYGGTIVSTVDLTGPYSIETDTNNRLILSDVAVSDLVIFDPAQILPTGYAFAGYTTDSGTFSYVDNTWGDLNIYLIATNMSYTLTFVLSGFDSGVSFETANITDLSISDFASPGYKVSFPTSVSSDYTLVSVAINGPDYTVTTYDGYFYVDTTYLDTDTSVQTIYITYSKGAYTVRFEYQDDASTVVSGSQVTADATSITLQNPAYQMRTKVGYTASYWYIQGLEEYRWSIDSNSALIYADVTALFQDQTALDYLAKNGNRIVFQVSWAPNTYTVRFATSGETYAVQMTTNQSVNVSGLADTVNVSKTGYTLAGWYLGEDTDDTSADNYISASATTYTLTPEVISAYASGTTISTVQDWAAKTYTITFDSDGGSPFVASSYTKTVSYGGSFEMPDHGSATKSFHEYNNWIVLTTSITARDGDTVTIGDTLAEVGDANNGTITFTMNWTSSDYTIVFNLNGGNGTSISAVYPVNVGDDLILPGMTGSTVTVDATREGYYFEGWYWTSDSTVIIESDKFDEAMASMAESNDGILTLYIVWGKLSYTITYNYDNGVAGEQAPTTAYYGVGMTISNPTRTGYRFVGWTAEGLTDGAQQGIGSEYITWNGTSYSTATVFKDLCSDSNGTVTMTAHWEKLTYYVEYNFNGGDGETIDMGEGTVGDAFTFASGSGITREGYSFAGWSLDGETVISSSTFTQSMAFAADDNNVVTLYAVWSPQSYTIQYRFSESEDYLSVTAYYGSATALGTPTMTGYSFAGWSASGSVASGARYSNDATVWYTWPETGTAVGSYVMNLAASSSDTVQLTATWTEVEYRIVYSVNGASAEAPTDGNVYTLGDALTLADYSYLTGTNGNKLIVGWSTDQTSTVAMSVSEFVEGLAQYADQSNRVTLYAVWVEGSYTLKVDLNGATTSYIPSGWSLGEDGLYYTSVDYGSSTKEALADWDDAVITKEGYTFSSWSYTMNTVVTDLTVTAEFSEVQMWLIYVFAGVVAAVPRQRIHLLGNVVYVRRE
ncbi:MAG: leucine-rich repeat protein [Thermoplasmata archaeon]|nr:leucine-rich repeat protein [Thermoplasmata archaeon]